MYITEILYTLKCYISEPKIVYMTKKFFSSNTSSVSFNPKQNLIQKIIRWLLLGRLYHTKVVWAQWGDRIVYGEKVEQRRITKKKNVNFLMKWFHLFISRCMYASKNARRSFLNVFLRAFSTKSTSVQQQKNSTFAKSKRK